LTKKIENSLPKSAKKGGGNEVNDEGKEESNGDSGSSVSEIGQERKGQDA